MKYRILGKTGFNVSEISLGTWQVGGKWGAEFDHALADNILKAAVDAGINFIDTADVYSGGESEIAVGRMLKHAGQRIYVATKCGRYIKPHVNEGYTPQALRKYVEASLQRLGVERIDIIQLHCPPVEVYYRPEIFDFFETLKKEGKILHLGVSVEKVEEALKAVEFENVATVQIIYNIFRQRPAERFFGIAKEKNVGIICRVPLASGLLAGKYTRSTQFGKGDHRRDNRKGEMFDRGETFSGIPFEEGLKTVDRLKGVFSGDVDLAHAALKWILMREEIGCIIPGASSVEQVRSNIKAVDFPDLQSSQVDEIDGVYRDSIKPLVHHLW